MDKRKVAVELLKIAKSLVARNHESGMGDDYDWSVTHNQECENWVRDFLQESGGRLVREGEILNKGKRFGFDRALLKKVLKEFVRDKYVAKEGSSYKWIENM